MRPQVTGQRTILAQTFRLDNQLALPAGSRISFPALQIQTDSDNYTDPKQFNPYRFMTSNTNPGGEALSASRIDDKYLA
jgi:cytochrome P450